MGEFSNTVTYHASRGKQNGIRGPVLRVLQYLNNNGGGGKNVGTVLRYSGGYLR